jgi:uncharacterized membrane protein
MGYIAKCLAEGERRMPSKLSEKGQEYLAALTSHDASNYEVMSTYGRYQEEEQTIKKKLVEQPQSSPENEYVFVDNEIQNRYNDLAKRLAEDVQGLEHGTIVDSTTLIAELTWFNEYSEQHQRLTGNPIPGIEEFNVDKPLVFGVLSIREAKTVLEADSGKFLDCVKQRAQFFNQYNIVESGINQGNFPTLEEVGNLKQQAQKINQSLEALRDNESGVEDKLVDKLSIDSERMSFLSLVEQRLEFLDAVKVMQDNINRGQAPIPQRRNGLKALVQEFNQSLGVLRDNKGGAKDKLADSLLLKASDYDLKPHSSSSPSQLRGDLEPTVQTQSISPIPVIEEQAIIIRRLHEVTEDKITIHKPKLSSKQPNSGNYLLRDNKGKAIYADSKKLTPKQQGLLDRRAEIETGITETYTKLNQEFESRISPSLKPGESINSSIKPDGTREITIQGADGQSRKLTAQEQGMYNKLYNEKIQDYAKEVFSGSPQLQGLNAKFKKMPIPTEQLSQEQSTTHSSDLVGDQSGLKAKDRQPMPERPSFISEEDVGELLSTVGEEVKRDLEQLASLKQQYIEDTGENEQDLAQQLKEAIKLAREHGNTVKTEIVTRLTSGMQPSSNGQLLDSYYTSVTDNHLHQKLLQFEPSAISSEKQQRSHSEALSEQSASKSQSQVQHHSTESINQQTVPKRQ